MLVHVKGDVAPYEFGPISIRCPSCRQIGSFERFRVIPDVAWSNSIEAQTRGQFVKAGMRVCPNDTCRAVVFYTEMEKVRATFPPEIIDFDATNLPNNILQSLEEAIQCHASGCFRASALMVRRTLEELCDDKNAKGRTLKDRISALSSTAVIPGELLSAADELRLLGNDAAHIEAKDYDKIGKDESELAIELAKELLKAVYQYSSLVSRLKNLKTPKTP